MSALLRVLVISIFVVLVSGLYHAPANAGLTVFTCHDHPNGSEVPPTYGLRIDDLLGSGVYTFSFDHVDGTGAANVTLTYDDVLNEIHIYGRVYGGKDVGGAWDVTEQGWMDIDFYYRDFLQTSDDCAGSAGDDVYVTGESANNTGSFSLDGWGGNAVFNFDGKANGSGCAFIFDNDTDSKGNATIAGDPATYSASGWLKPPTTGFRDWLFIAVMGTVPVEEKSWGSVKALYAE